MSGVVSIERQILQQLRAAITLANDLFTLACQPPTMPRAAKMQRVNDRLTHIETAAGILGEAVQTMEELDEERRAIITARATLAQLEFLSREIPVWKPKTLGR